MHQALNRKDATTYVSGRQDESLVESSLQPSTSQASTGDWWDIIEDALSATLEDWRSRSLEKYTSDQSRDQLEGELAATLHEGLQSLPATVLTDRDFWRYCSAYLYDFVIWRQPSKTVSALHPYFGIASDSLGTDCVPHRMLNRAHIASAGFADETGDRYELAKFGAADVWKSHILRVRNSYAPLLVRELLLDVKTGKLPTDPVRLLAKNLRRVRSNVLFEVLEDHQARVLLNREEQRVATMIAAPLDSKPPEG